MPELLLTANNACVSVYAFVVAPFSERSTGTGTSQTNSTAVQ